MSRTFTVAGTSNLNGVVTYRFASSTAKARKAVLERDNHTDVNLIDLPNPMSKDDAIAHLNSIGITAVLPKTGRTPKAKTTETVEAGAKALLDAVADVPAEAPAEEAVVEEDVAFLTNMQAG